MLQALVVVPAGPGPGGVDARDLAALFGLPEGVRQNLSVTVATPTGEAPSVDETTLSWVRYEPEDDWAYLAWVGERSRPTLAALSEGDVRTLGLQVCRAMRDHLVRNGVPTTSVQTLLSETVQEVRSRLASFGDIFPKLLDEATGLGDLDGAVCFEYARGELEALCRQMAAEVETTLEGTAALISPVTLEAATEGTWDVVFVPGGGEHVLALGAEPQVGALLATTRNDGSPVAVVGAGAAALLAVEDTIDGWPFDGVVMSAPAEGTYSFLGNRTWSNDSLRNRLLRRGAIIDETGPDWTSRVTEDRGVISGRNSRSAATVYLRALARARGGT